MGLAKLLKAVMAECIYLFNGGTYLIFLMNGGNFVNLS